MSWVGIFFGLTLSFRDSWVDDPSNPNRIYNPTLFEFCFLFVSRVDAKENNRVK